VSQATIIREEVKEVETSFSVIYIDMGNACLVFLSEGGDRLGTLAASMPPREHLIGPPLSSILFGDRNTLLARLLAEHVAQETRRMTLTSVYLKTVDEKRAGPVLIRLLSKVMKRQGGKQ